MKIKLKYLSLVIFILVQLAICNITSIIKPEHTSKSPSKLKLNHDHNNNKKQTKFTPNLSQHTEFATPYSRVNDYFKNTSKKNQGMAAKALSAFVLGIILFICSIHFICWNERRAVKETHYIDYIRHEKKCLYLDNNNKQVELKPENNNNKVIIISGPATVTREATIENLPLTIQTDKGKICVVKTVFEKFSKSIRIENEEVKESADGETLMKREEITTRNWNTTDYTNNRFTCGFHYGEVLISNKYSFPMTNLNSHVESNQTASLADNSYIYRPNQSDIQTLEEYFKGENNDDSKPYKIIIKDQYIYILRSNVNIHSDSGVIEFNPESYEFSDADIRMTIKYFYIPNEETIFTIGGKLNKADEKEFITPFITDLSKAGCSYFCCCCTDDESKYEVDLLYIKKMTRDDIVNEMEEKNNACTCISRIGGFAMHFMSIYLILYPIILLVGMIPFLGAIGATVLIFFAFILSLMTFLFIIACAWVCARPVYAAIIFGFIFILFFVGKTSRDQMQESENNDNSQNGNNYNYNNNSNNNHSSQKGDSRRTSVGNHYNSKPERKFL